MEKNPRQTEPRRSPDQRTPRKKPGRIRNLPTMTKLIGAVILVVLAVLAGIGIRSWRTARAEQKAADFQAKVDAKVAADQAAAAAEQAAQEAAAAAAAEASAAEAAQADETQVEDPDYFEDVIAEYTSLYDVENTAKETNLRLACEALNGTVVKPGDTFSFNDVVGERTEEKGYQAAGIYYANDIKQELGGGICQVASTIYYCALCADLEIVERTVHHYLVSYVPGGIDATIYWGRYDFKFTNNTDYSIRIDAVTADGQCHIAFYSKNVNHYITVLKSTMVSANPYETETEYGDPSESVRGINGYTYKISREIYDSNGQLVREDTSDDLGKLGISIYAKRDAIIYKSAIATDD